ncbi:class I SAM-dependent methyltransferase [Poriferisphaera sp. WC338]|uniref:class I SAM-dependent methyltransferase n=1 Tax=Poriferisphaera sp. WC338 TaxID=3425129 RepID=UPI003D81AFDF
MTTVATTQSTSYSCTICNNDMQPWLNIPGDFRRPDIKDTYPLYWCNTCNFGQLKPTPTPDQISTFYQLPEYCTHTDARNQTRPHTYLQKLRAHLAWRLDQSSEMYVPRFREFAKQGISSCCDIGCGGGKSLRRMKEAGITDLVGVEPDPEAIKNAQSHGFTIYQGTAENLPTEALARKFDLVLITHVLEHTTAPVIAIRNLLKLVNSGGKLIVEIPNNLNAGCKQDARAWPWLDVPRHLNFFSAQSLIALCEKSGWKVQSTEYRGYCRQFEPTWFDFEDQINRQQNTMLNKKPKSNLSMELSRWRRFVRTAFASSDLKYDSVRVIATKP